MLTVPSTAQLVEAAKASAEMAGQGRQRTQDMDSGA